MKDKMRMILTVMIVSIAVFAAGLYNEEKLKKEYLSSDNAISAQDIEGAGGGSPADAADSGVSQGETEEGGAEAEDDGSDDESKLWETAIVIDDEPQPKRTEPITLAFAGDLLLDPGYAVMSAMQSRGARDGSLMLGAFDDRLIQLMRNADIFMLNNEFPYSNGGSPTAGKQFTFRARPESAALLHDIGVDIVSLANNHAYDYGESALLDTLDTLEAENIPYVGAGRDIQEASKPYIFDIGGLKIAYISATQIERLSTPDTKGAGETTPGVFRCLDASRLLQIIRETKEEADFVVVYIHWGTESTDQTDWLQQEQAPQIAQAGADLIIGDHPHVLQKIDYIGDVPVYYSLGNYLFNSKTQDTCLVTVSIDPQTAQICDMVFTPALQSGCRTVSLDGAERARVLEYMRSISPGVHIDDEGRVSRGAQ